MSVEVTVSVVTSPLHRASFVASEAILTLFGGESTVISTSSAVGHEGVPVVCSALIVTVAVFVSPVSLFPVAVNTPVV